MNQIVIPAPLAVPKDERHVIESAVMNLHEQGYTCLNKGEVFVFKKPGLPS